MFVADQWQDFELIDCSKGEKLERWGRFYLVRPDPQAIWDTPRRNPHWNDRNARYKRSETGGGSWDKGDLPENWRIRYGELTFNVKPMNFKHTGLFPEQAANWDWAMDKIRKAGREISVLNLFGYTGAATVACLKAGASVCHVDAAKGMVAWGKDNAAASGLQNAPVRWIVDDCAKDTSTTRSSWTRPPTAEVPAARSGSWSRISGPLSRSAPGCCRTSRSLCLSTPTPRASRRRF